MELLVGAVILLFGMAAACCVFAFVFAVCLALAINTIWYSPLILLLSAKHLLIGMRLLAAVLAITIRDLGKEAARGMTVFEAQPQWQSEARARAKAEAAIPKIDCWEAACTLLGLSLDGFGKTELSRAYRAAIVTAHPDLGGNPQLAQAVNVARDLIRDSQGWK